MHKSRKLMYQTPAKPNGVQCSLIASSIKLWVQTAVALAVQGGVIHFTLKPTWVSSKVPVPAKLSGTLPAVQPISSHL